MSSVDEQPEQREDAEVDTTAAVPETDPQEEDATADLEQEEQQHPDSDDTAAAAFPHSPAVAVLAEEVERVLPQASLPDGESTYLSPQSEGFRHGNKTLT